MMRPLKATAFALTILLCLSGCRGTTPTPMTQPEAPPAPAVGAETAAPSLPHEVRWVRGSAEYRAILIQTYRFASEVLAAKAADLEPGTWAVALDADETVIDNSLYQQERAAIGEEYTSETWAEWVARREAPPLPGVLGFLAKVRELGGKIAIVTNRREAWCGDTEANFRAYDIPFDVILCRGEESRKEPRWQRIEDGTAASDLPPLKIVMWLGDNIRDFPNLDQDLRLGEKGAFEGFGGELFVVPNPMYGSWEGNPKD